MIRDEEVCDVYVCGIATDVCVGNTVIDNNNGLKYDFNSFNSISCK